MKLFLMPIEGPTQRGVLLGHTVPYTTRHGIPVGHPQERSQDGWPQATPGMVVCAWHADVDNLYTIDSDGEAITLPLSVQVVNAGLASLFYAEDATDPRGGPRRIRVRGICVDEDSDDDGDFVVVESRKS